MATRTISQAKNVRVGLTIQATKPSKDSTALDQWRGLALILVLISHGFFFTGRVNGLGRIGVNLFFFISGILVYRSLNKSRVEWWSLAKSFWWRRVRRLYPALISYAVIMLVATVFLQHLSGLPPHSDLKSYAMALPYALTYTLNYAHIYPNALGHLWSLACEMQFYLLAPFIFALGRGSRRRGLYVFGLLVLLFGGAGLIYPLRLAHYDPVKYHFEIAAWPMMFGFFCEFAKAWFMKIPRSLVKIILGIGVVALIGSPIVSLFGMEMKKLVIAMGALVLFPCLFSYLFELSVPGIIGRFAAWVGERTYSIYLWEEPLTTCNFLPFMLQPLGAAVSIAIGAAWFRIFEMPFLSMGRVRQIKTAPTLVGSPSGR
jgi:peptidoglycan/LPS O-acetylase OafA/YrhL